MPLFTQLKVNKKAVAVYSNRLLKAVSYWFEQLTNFGPDFRTPDRERSQPCKAA